MPACPAVRLAGASDVPDLVALVESAYRGEESRRGWTTEADLLTGRRTDTDEVAGLVGGEQSLVLVAQLGGALVGCCAVQRRSRTEGYFGMFAVRPRRQGAGIGHLLLDRAEQVCVDRWGLRQLRMLVLRPRTELIEWYRRRGYELTGETVPFSVPAAVPADRARGAGLAFVALVKPLPAR